MERYEARQRREMKAVFRSLEPELTTKLEEIDYMVRQIISEMKTAGASSKMIAEYLPQQFERIKREVVAKGNEYEKREKKVRA